MSTFYSVVGSHQDYSAFLWLVWRELEDTQNENWCLCDDKVCFNCDQLLHTFFLLSYLFSLTIVILLYSNPYATLNLACNLRYVYIFQCNV